MNRFSSYLVELGLSQAEASRFLGLSDRTVRHWVGSDNEPPLHVLMLLALMIKRRLSTDQVRATVGLPPLKPVKIGRPRRMSIEELKEST